MSRIVAVTSIRVTNSSAPGAGVPGKEDDMAEPFYRVLIGSSLSGSGMGSGREWSLKPVYSESVLSSVFGKLVNGREREWGMAY